MAYVAPGSREALQETEECFIGFGLTRSFIKVRQAAFWKKQTVLVAEHDRLTQAAVLVLLKRQLPQIAIRVFPGFHFDASEVLSETEGTVPCRRSRDARARLNAL